MASYISFMVQSPIVEENYFEPERVASSDSERAASKASQYGFGTKFTPVILLISIVTLHGLKKELKQGF